MKKTRMQKDMEDVAAVQTPLMKLFIDFHVMQCLRVEEEHYKREEANRNSAVRGEEEG